MSAPAPSGSGRLALAIILLVLAALGLSLWAARVHWRAASRRAECHERLRFLALSADQYRAKYGAWPAATGPAFWEAIVAGSGLSPEKKVDVLRCPVTGKRYRGPAAAPGEWLGCCEPGTHGEDVLAIDAKRDVIAARCVDPALKGTRGDEK